MDVDLLGPFVIGLMLVAGGLYYLFCARKVAERHALEQERRGRKWLTKYERSTINRLTIRFGGLVSAIAGAALSAAIAWHSLKR